MKFDFRGIKNTTKALTDRLHELGVEVDELRAERRRIESAPAAKADVKAALQAWVKAKALAFEPKLAAQLERIASRPADLAAQRPDGLMFGLAGHPLESDAPLSSVQLDALLCSYFAPTLLPLLMHAVDAGVWEEGLTNAARQVRFDAIDDRIRKATAEIKQLRTEAVEAGLDV